ncbi:MAG TPA: pantoate--beta-alanine ligase [Candidatus Acidoferrum sp.]|nr:pantoate--beta-alanine ligase [Candidatus Acidoferrum sp.]
MTTTKGTRRVNTLAVFSSAAKHHPMRIIKSVSTMQRTARQWRQAATRVAFVPTMGYLHEGHASLVREARKRVGKRGMVVVSIYVNPTQFAPTEDLSNYPRDVVRDRQLCRDAAVDVIFFPTDAEMYPGKAEGKFSTYVVEELLSRGMEGASRPTHFRGVTTIVAKLFNIVLPDFAVFGAKDFQQVAVIQRMTRDLNFAVKIVVAPTVREADGLALSSRNKYLDADQRQQATALWGAIQKAKSAVRSGPQRAGKLKHQLQKFIETRPAAHVDYIEFFDAETLAPTQRVERGTHVALAVFVGKTRLIDNARL